MGGLGKTDIMSIFDIILLVYGIYTIYASFAMKKTGVPSKWLVPEQEMGRCKDSKGFIDAIYKKTILFGVLVVVYGVVSTINHFFLSIWALEIGCIVFFLFIVIFYMVAFSRTKKEFFYS